MSIESFDKLLVLVGLRITYENTRLRMSVPPQERLAVREYFAKSFTSPSLSFAMGGGGGWKGDVGAIVSSILWLTLLSESQSWVPNCAT